MVKEANTCLGLSHHTRLPHQLPQDPTQSLGSNVNRNSLVDTFSVYKKPVSDEEKKLMTNLDGCYTGRITHILRFCAPSIALDFFRSFNSLRTEFFADLLDGEPGMLRNHLFSSAILSGIGLAKSSFLCQSALLDGGKIFIYEFFRKFPANSHLLVPSCSPYLNELSCELDRLPPQIWTKCFPQSIQEIPNRSLFNLQFCCKNLQQKLSKIFESLDFNVRLGLAKKKNPAFANLLQDM
ncbi:hypothetical protein P9112_002410 [Eukaryota sp. TZLM1-RC]